MNFDFTLDRSFEYSPHPMWFYDIKTLKFLTVNAAAVRQYGYSKEEFISRSMVSITPEEDLPLLDFFIENIIHGRDAGERTVRHKKKDGTIFPVKLKCNILAQSNNTVVLATATDINNMVKFEKKISLQNRIFQCISDVNNNFVRNQNWLKALDACLTIICESQKIQRAYFFQCDPHYKTIASNVFYSRQNGKFEIADTEAQSLPFPLVQMLMVPMRKRRKFESTLSRQTNQTMRDIFEARRIKSILAMPIFCQNEFKGFVYLEDCELERKWLKEELLLMDVLTSNLSQVMSRTALAEKNRIIERKFNTLVQRSNDLIAIVDLRGNFKYASPTYMRQFGCAKETLLEHNFFQNLSSEDLGRVRGGFELVPRKNQIFLGPYKIQYANGGRKWMESVLTNHLAEPSINGIVVNTTDVTSKVRDQMRRELVLELTKTIGHAQYLIRGLNKTVEKLAEEAMIEVSGVWLKSKEGNHLKWYSGFCDGNMSRLGFERHIPIKKIEQDLGLRDKPMKSNKIIFLENIDYHCSFIRRDVIANAGLKTAIGMPIVSTGEFIGCFLLFSKYAKEALLEETEIFNGLGHDLGDIIRQKLVEEEYRIFFEASPDPFCIVGFDGKIKQTNKAFASRLGFTKKQMLGKSYKDFIHELDGLLLDEKLKKNLGKDVDFGNEIRMITSNNDEKRFVWSHTVKKDENLVLSVAKDITENESAEKLLKLANNRLDWVQRVANLGHWCHHFNLDRTEWSEKTYEIYGHSPDDFRPTMEKIIKTIHPEDRNLITRGLRETWEPNKTLSVEHRIITASGTTRWVQQEARLIVDSQGNPLYLEGVVQDITEKKQYQHELKKCNSRIPLAMLASDQKIWELDHGKNLLVHTHVADSVHEQVVRERFAKNNSWFARVHPEDLNRVWESLTAQLNDVKRSRGAIEYRIQGSRGGIVYMVDTFYVQRDARGVPVYTIGAVTDITSTKQQLKKIEIQNRMLGDIAWSQSHVVRSPLTRIMSLLNLYENKGQDPLSIEVMLKLIRTSVEEIDTELHEIIKKINTNYVY